MTRGHFTRGALFSLAGLYAYPYLPAMAKDSFLMRAIPSTGEKIPAIGLGSWLTFNVGDSEKEREPMRNVLREFAALGGRVVDSSPMYGRSERVIGELAAELSLTDKLWFATKVWTSGEQAGKGQIDNSVDYLGKWPSVLQVHNLLDLNTHIKTLRALKEEGKLKYIGFTHYMDYAHTDVASLLRKERPDFIQINLSIRSRAAEDYLLPLAQDKGVAVIVNQPFETGGLFGYVQGKPLPSWAGEWGMTTWASFFLKYIISNSSVTCVIPATRQVAHVRENMAAGVGPLPDAKTRKMMVDYFTQQAG